MDVPGELRGLGDALRRRLAPRECLLDGGQTDGMRHGAGQADTRRTDDTVGHVERGRHADLLERGGAYAAMWAKQQETLEDVEAD